MVEYMGLKLLNQDHLEWQNLPTKFHENPQIGSNVNSGGHRQTDRQTDTHTHRQTDRLVI
jgi:hypothetical protein